VIRRRPRSLAAQARTHARGQSTVEYALVVPVLLLILLGILEFGFAFSHHITMEYATREGARTGAALNNGDSAFACADVDDEIIAAVQRVITGTGSKVAIAHVTQIRIYKADADGKEAGPVEIWGPGAGNAVDGVALKFVRTSGNWSACSRLNTGFHKTDSLGVSMSYDYQYVTPLGILMGIGGNAQLHMTDRTVMALNPD
jgi:hypothetical protein